MEFLSEHDPSSIKLLCWLWALPRSAELEHNAKPDEPSETHTEAVRVPLRLRIPGITGTARHQTAPSFISARTGLRLKEYRIHLPDQVKTMFHPPSHQHGLVHTRTAMRRRSCVRPRARGSRRWLVHWKVLKMSMRGMVIKRPSGVST